jgi:tRNA (guanine9-N1)-methyltransferase
MAELEGRPSKIRKLESPVESYASSQSNSVTQEAPERPLADPTCYQRDAEELPSHEDESEKKPKLSKSQLKKLRKAERWEAGKEYRRMQRREKHKLKQARKAEQRAELQAKIENGETDIIPQKRDEEKQKYPRRPIQVPVSLILDCAFNELMTEKELISLGAQLTRCYSDNRKSPYRSHLALSSWGGILKTRFETVLTNNHLGWKGVKFYEGDFMVAADDLDEVMRSPSGGKPVSALAKEAGSTVETEQTLLRSAPSSEVPESSKETNVAAGSAISIVPEISQNSNGSTTLKPGAIIPLALDSSSETHQEIPSSKKEDAASEDTTSVPPVRRSSPSIVYLTSDSPHTLECLSPNTSYIIGGLVDKNRHKGICYKRACGRGIPTAKLPIGEYMTMQSRSVLAINHVVEIMLKWLVTGDWGEAFLSVIPKRKEPKLKAKKSEENEGEEAESEDEGEGGVSALESKVGEDTDEGV